MTRTATQRAKDATARRQSEGGRVVRVILSPAATRALARLTGSGMTMTDAIQEALMQASPPTPTTDAAGFLAAATKGAAA